MLSLQTPLENASELGPLPKDGSNDNAAFTTDVEDVDNKSVKNGVMEKHANQNAEEASVGVKKAEPGAKETMAWDEVARTFDRFLFLVFSVNLVVLTLAFLLVLIIGEETFA